MGRYRNCKLRYKNCPKARRITSCPYIFAALDPKYTPKIAARFARRIASFSFVFAALDPNTPKFPRRASRAGLLHSPMFVLLLTPNSLFFRGALRAPVYFLYTPYGFPIDSQRIPCALPIFVLPMYALRISYEFSIQSRAVLQLPVHGELVRTRSQSAL